MQEEISHLALQIKNYKANTLEDIEKFRLQYVSKKGVVGKLFDRFRELSSEDKKAFGGALNELKSGAMGRLKELSATLETQLSRGDAEYIDVTLPSIYNEIGAMHPISWVKNKMIEIFVRQGFNIEMGPEIDDDWHNFTALNFPINHPARDMQDTYFVRKNPDFVLRTHTSNVQIRLMDKSFLPIRSIMPGRVYRNESVSARSHCFFHQVEGLFVAEEVSFRDLKNTLYHFSKEMFGKNTQIRFRPSYFPFTEPSAEMDINCFICGGSGCKVCKQTGWVEIAGSGMVDPNVLQNCNIDFNKYTGFAFGMGVERIAMLKYQIDDLRLFSENDIRFLQQF